MHWFKEEKLITNGTDGIYHSVEKEGNNLRSTLYFPSGQEDQEGLYKCNATNSIPGWSSSAAYEIEMLLLCKKKTIRKIMAPTFFQFVMRTQCQGHQNETIILKGNKRLLYCSTVTHISGEGGNDSKTGSRQRGRKHHPCLVLCLTPL